ncbi:MAG TPA: hypothetical protein VLG50_06510 [Candidatus Saccharimonadales bacterium]|nr:hypothetical protein [Candidatus Saccharimonadales bacterium]
MSLSEDIILEILYELNEDDLYSICHNNKYYQSLCSTNNILSLRINHYIKIMNFIHNQKSKIIISIKNLPGSLYPYTKNDNQFGIYVFMYCNNEIQFYINKEGFSDKETYVKIYKTIKDIVEFPKSNFDYEKITIYRTKITYHI